MNPLDLVVLFADKDAEVVMNTLLRERTQALGIRAVHSKIIRDTRRDPGVYLHAQDLLRPYQRQAAYALVMLDREGSGREARMSAEEIEEELTHRLLQSGWQTPQGQPRVAVIVLDPELEIWVWSQSPHVPAALGLDENSLANVLQSFHRLPNGKPERPKEAMLAALRTAKKPFSPDIFKELAQKVTLRSREHAFNKLRHTLQTWFPLQEDLP